MNIYYVYGHYLNGELVYIGKGTDNRAWSSKRFDQNHQMWANDQIMINNWGNCVKIILSNLSSKDARAQEKQLIESNKPKWNSESKEHACEHCGYKTKTIQGMTSHLRRYH